MLYWGSDPGERPHDFIESQVPTWQRDAIVFVLAHGVDAHPGISAKGWANCRLCGAQLGSGDFTRYGFVWPEKAEHYLTVHGVWTPECSALLQAVLSFDGSF